MKTVIYHSADFDGIFCREIARKFLGEKDVQYTGWNFGDAPIALPINGEFVVMDLPIDKPFGLAFRDGWLVRGDERLQPLDRVDWQKFTWIDHHKTSIESHPKDIPGYRIDGVAACRLAWQWFNRKPYPTFDKEWCELPCKEYFVERIVREPLSVQLAGEYDVWDKRDSKAETFQYGLRTVKELAWEELLDESEFGATYTDILINQGKYAQAYSERENESVCKHLSWLMDWEGLKWLCINTAHFNSLFFASRDVPETGHDALLGFRWDGKTWVVSLYHAKHRTELDLSAIAVKYGGGGHRGACGFTCQELPFMA